MSAFCVVQFEDLKIEAVPSKWIIHLDQNGVVCKWPKSTHNFQGLVRNQAVPEEDWISYSCQILKYSSTLLEARRKTKNIENDASSTSEDERGRGCSRKSKVGHQTPITLNESQTAKYTKRNELPAPSNTNSTSDDTYSDEGSHDVTFTEANQNGNEVLGNEVISAINKLIEKVTVLEKKQDMMLEEIAKLSVFCKTEGMTSALHPRVAGRQLECLPLTSLEEIQDFDRELESEDFMQKYVQHLKIFIGNKTDNSIRNCLASIYNGEVAKQCAWTSAKGNHSVNSLRQIAVMEDVLRNYHSEMTKDDFKTHTPNWFRRSGTRYNRAKVNTVADIQ